MDKIWLQHYQAGVPSEINANVFTSLAELFETSCLKFKDRLAYSNFGSYLTYQQTLTLSRTFAAYLQQSLHCKKGDCIAIMLPNILQYPIILFGALLAGLTVTNVNPLYTVDELVHQLNDAGATIIVVLTNFAHTVEKASPKTRLKKIIVTEIGDLFQPFKGWLINNVVKYIKRAVPSWNIPQAIYFKKILQASNQLQLNPVLISPEDVALLQYTGGTTGVAKAAVLTHRNIIANVEQVVAWVRPVINEDTPEIGVTPLPLYHIFSLTANCFFFCRVGALNLLITNPRDIAGMVKQLMNVSFSMLTGVNTLFNALLNHPDFMKLNFSRLKVTMGGGAPVQRVVAERWRAITGKILLEGYGLTEASPVVSITPLNLQNYNGSIGLPVSSTAVSIRNENNQEVALGQTGELCIKGPQIMREYWRMPTETAQIFTSDGWLKTGDIARMDTEGFIYIVDRKKDMILVSGFNVYPTEIEAVIATHPGVSEVAVVGVPDRNTGEAVKAFVVRKDPTLTTDALLAFCREHLTGYKLPKQIEFRTSLPKSPVGKILHRLLRENAVN